MNRQIPVREGFDRADAESPFLRFVASEFHRRGTPRRLALSKKLNSHPFVCDLGLQIPRIIATTGSLHDLDWLSLPDRFVLKYAHGWSARGVMLLERQGDSYFNDLSLRSYSRDEVVREQERVAATFAPAPAEWIVEEYVRPTVSVGPIPFDYKFYSFDGRVAMVAQYDRNANPPKIALFDGDFVPLRHGRDYLRDPARLQRGVPLVPLHAAEMLWWAKQLSRQADSPFVSVDMYDSPEGPVFGEFTYSSGAAHRRMLVFSHEQLERLDRYMAGDGEAGALPQVSWAEARRLSHTSPAVYSRMAGFAYNSGSRGARRLAELHQRTDGHAASNEARWQLHVASCWKLVGKEIEAVLRREAS